MIFLLIFNFILIKAEPIGRNVQVALNETLNTRRILGGREVGETRPYMVYLRPSSAEHVSDSNWLCGGVIIHERYILTSAACIEDVKQFYVISGTHKWVQASDNTNECVNNGAKKAIWKCVPKSYVFDGNEFDNIQWMVKDIAVVKVEDDFNFKRRIRGCDFIPKKVAFNNVSEDLEKAGTVGSIAGWGSTERFGDDIIQRTTVNSADLMETDVVLLSKKNCKRRWHQRYHHVIDSDMICAKDALDTDAMSLICSEQEVNCKELVYSDEEEEETRKFMVDPQKMAVHTADHLDETRRSKVMAGGFCENDHGGPLVVGQGKSAVVVGIISACLTRDLSRKCYGPFLYTSVWKNRHLINCAINKEMGETCRRLLRSTKTQIIETTFNWGPIKDFQELRAVTISHQPVTHASSVFHPVTFRTFRRNTMKTVKTMKTMKKPTTKTENNRGKPIT